MFPSIELFSLDTLHVHLLLEVDGTSSLTRKYMFSDVRCFSVTLLIYIQIITFFTFLHIEYQSNSCSVLNSFSFVFHKAFLLIKLIAVQLQVINFVNICQLHHYSSTWFPSLLSLESSDCPYLVSEFLAISCRYLDTLNADYRA